ncbi:hypothetical protein ABZ769_35555 [Streptomyces olivoreticuli]
MVKSRSILHPKKSGTTIEAGKNMKRALAATVFLFGLLIPAGVAQAAPSAVNEGRDASTVSWSDRDDHGDGGCHDECSPCDRHRDDERHEGGHHEPGCGHGCGDQFRGFNVLNDFKILSIV